MIEVGLSLNVSGLMVVLTDVEFEAGTFDAGGVGEIVAVVYDDELLFLDYEEYVEGVGLVSVAGFAVGINLFAEGVVAV